MDTLMGFLNSVLFPVPTIRSKLKTEMEDFCLGNYDIQSNDALAI